MIRPHPDGGRGARKPAAKGHRSDGQGWSAYERHRAIHSRLTTNRKGDQVIEKREVTKGPKAGKRGYVDAQGRIWIRDRAHSGLPDHWDVQIDDWEEYFRVDCDENPLA
jgi:hypothetical protein